MHRRLRQIPAGLAVFLFLLACGTAALADTAPPASALPVDLAAFATTNTSDSCLQWNGPVRVQQVRVFAPASAQVRDWRVEWWGSVWPDNGTGGWMRLDDPWNGQWVKIATEPRSATDGAWIFDFPPLTRAEWSHALPDNRYPNQQAPSFRKTLKLRVVTGSGQPIPPEARVQIFGDAHWTEGAFDLHHRLARDGDVAFRIDVTHGTLLQLQPLTPGTAAQGDAWSARDVAGASAGVRIRIRYVESPDAAGEERTRVTVRTRVAPDATGFSFVPQDVPARDAMRLPDFGFLIARAERGRTWENDPGPGPEMWRKRVRQRLTERPEATRESALAGLPRLTPARDVPLGVPSARQEFFVTPAGDWAILALSLNTDNGRDAKRWVFKPTFGNERQPDELRALLDTRAQPAFDGRDREDAQRHLEADHLPLIHVRWRTGPLAFHHELATTILEGDYGDDATRRGDETVVLLTRLTVTNTSATPQLATVHLRYNLDWPLHLGPDGVLTVDWPTNRARPAGLTAVRVQVQETAAGAPPGTWDLQPADKPGHSARLRWQARLAPGEQRVLHFKAPFVELLEPGELDRLKAIQFETAVPAMLEYWRHRLGSRTQLEVPDPKINHFYEANLWHVLITTDRDPETGLYNQGVGTVTYRVFANETVMIARYLDLVGEPREAERFLEPLLRFQGAEPLTGRFTTREGVFHSAGQYTHGQYAMNHGFVLWGVADHYLLTRDQAYLERVAPQLVRGCDFLQQERRATFTPPGQPRSPVHGLAPASSLEDVIEFQYWLAANSYFYLGWKRAAEALADLRHPDAARLARDAEAYRADIERAAREAATQAAVVPLRDGAWIPYVPSRIYQWRHLTEGWIREALYPALHLAAGEVVGPRDPLIGWMLDDLEDNLFFSWQSGYNVSDFEQTWFEHGGVTLQPCLLEVVPTCLARDEVPAALRNFWNTYALSIYPDVHCFAEWARRFGQAGGPVYKTSDEARFLLWLRQLLLWENGRELWYGRGLPRAWLADGKTVRLERAVTPFGPTSLRLRSEVARGRIEARIDLPGRKLPEAVWVRLRHPGGLLPASCTLNGQALPRTDLYGENVRLSLKDRAPGERVVVEASYPMAP